MRRAAPRHRAVELEQAELTVFPLAEGAVDAMQQMVLVSPTRPTALMKPGHQHQAETCPQARALRRTGGCGQRPHRRRSKRTVAMTHGIEFTKYLGNLPANPYCCADTPGRRRRSSRSRTASR